MTCIVAVETENGVWMGADSAGSDGFTASSVESPKLFTNGPVLFGICGSFRMGQILRYGLTIPVHALGWDIDRWVATEFAKAMREAFEEHAWSRTEDGIAEAGSFLMAIQGRAYEIQSDYSFLRSPLNEYAVGSGTYHALGSLSTTRMYEGLSEEDRVFAALEVAAEHVTTVAGPFVVEHQEVGE